MSKSQESDLHPSSSTSFLAPNGIYNPYDFSDMELVSINHRKSSTSTSANNNNHNSGGGGAYYTSLKDILPATPSPPSGISPSHNSSWHEIPIRNHLVKQAAWAYLQPMSTPRQSGDSGFFSKLKSVCCEAGCFEYFTKSIFSVFSNRRDSDDDEVEDVDEDSYCCGGEKVD
ncbi:hypothetical protein QQ045_014790 [Rhodiola kirilowii]